MHGISFYWPSVAHSRAWAARLHCSLAESAPHEPRQSLFGLYFVVVCVRVRAVASQATVWWGSTCIS